MKTAFFNTKSYDRQSFNTANKQHQHEIIFFECHLSHETVSLAAGYSAVCIFINDYLDTEMLEKLAQGGTKLIALRSAGFNHVDLTAASHLGLTIVRVPAYSPYAVAEHAVALILSLNRKVHRAYNRVREGNFSIEGLLGFDLHGATVGVIGTGRIGAIFAQIMRGFGCKLIGYDAYQNSACLDMGMTYVQISELFAQSDIISLHCPLTPDSHHLINTEAIAQMKAGTMLINTSRGGLIDTQAAINGLKSGAIGYLGIDVYEQEADLFFEDLSNEVIQDDTFQRLLTFPNVIVTGHQAFFTSHALANIAETTLANITEFEQSGSCLNEVKIEQAIASK
ncbi:MULTISPECIES: 2-hydroxyacid dehydrogenase [Pseudanabaena]|jgi:D-lactate dehydrogenase|uniref:2-hydroxyacid dehydrogenase n=1 Tax=Pseudanabaena TaxID=1152 RepID=UPI002479F127|nr:MULTISPECIES: 2-hydroxyacid dehydrogenase [Pseudanabaena]MEA5489710.1 2-hydroxyacid dehydrogenase [Pseudanabaena sp. CCNP1317]WGS73869.1 2-hydroxyacid dehydrogenase [Pseudanabaena galeata CCNP1313]